MRDASTQACLPMGAFSARLKRGKVLHCTRGSESLTTGSCKCLEQEAGSEADVTDEQHTSHITLIFPLLFPILAMTHERYNSGTGYKCKEKDGCVGILFKYEKEIRVLIGGKEKEKNMLHICFVLVTFFLGLSQCFGSYVPCEPCDQKALSMCPPVPVGCQLVKEPGCGCCLTCALSEGQACGVYTGTCTHGLRCLPRNGEEKPLHALLHGRGVCTNEKGYKPLHPPIAPRLTSTSTPHDTPPPALSLLSPTSTAHPHSSPPPSPPPPAPRLTSTSTPHDTPPPALSLLSPTSTAHPHSSPPPSPPPPPPRLTSTSTPHDTPPPALSLLSPTSTAHPHSSPPPSPPPPAPRLTSTSTPHDTPPPALSLLSPTSTAHPHSSPPPSPPPPPPRLTSTSTPHDTPPPALSLLSPTSTAHPHSSPPPSPPPPAPRLTSTSTPHDTPPPALSLLSPTSTAHPHSSPPPSPPPPPPRLTSTSTPHDTPPPALSLLSPTSTAHPHSSPPPSPPPPPPRLTSTSTPHDTPPPALSLLSPTSLAHPHGSPPPSPPPPAPRLTSTSTPHDTPPPALSLLSPTSLAHPHGSPPPQQPLLLHPHSSPLPSHPPSPLLPHVYHAQLLRSHGGNESHGRKRQTRWQHLVVEVLGILVSSCGMVDWPDRESKEHDDPLKTDTTDEQLPHAKLPVYPKQDLINSKKQAAMRKDKKKQQEKLRSVGSPDYSPLPVDKHETEFGPCRRKLDGIIRGLKDTSRVMALSLYLPNCDRKGFFKRKQCKPSRGRKRGICWCVDKYGVQLPGTDYSGGNIQCKDLENSNNNNE
ncbi:hypothetical protein P4O66_015158 [Electrophorus voltai]|uniref:Insulin-like growth factor-binding protein 5 n=1 Tax=Electrophorus voltai TaxID=2609070 RepID=A0AAD9DQQ3_9TELE|nr:hypothetical protein P4O66_015158 [Electrophorus voltai]